MKIQHIKIKDFLGIRSLDVATDAPVQIFCGPNGAGKSSIQDAVALALQADLGRVQQKKDAGHLVHTGASHAEVAVVLDDGALSRNVVISSKGQIRDAGGTQATHGTAMPYVLRAQRFAGLGPTERRAFLFGVMGLAASGPQIVQMLIERGHPQKLLDTIAPLLRTGFDAAHKEAQARARDAKTTWRTLTGETYGEKKAASWVASAPQAASPESMAALDNDLKAALADLESMHQAIGAQQATARQEAETVQKAETLRQKASMAERLQAKLLIETEELQAWQAKVEETRQRASGTRKTGLVHELALTLDETLTMLIPQHDMDLQQHAVLGEANRLLDAYRAEHGPLIDRNAPGQDTDAQALLPEYLKALGLMQRAVANTQRDLEEAKAAQESIKTLPAHSPEQQAQTQKRLQEVRQAAEQAKAHVDHLRARIQVHKAAEQAAKSADETTAKANAAHDMVQAWSRMADDLSPDGIPAEMLTKCLGPINDRLEQSASITEWLRVRVEPDMTVWAGYPDLSPQPYELLSESERWRVDAMLAEAISHFSGLRLLLLDRMDVLDLTGRGDLVAWLSTLALENQIDTALVFATLKALPTGLPPVMAVHWVEDGMHGAATV